ARNPKHDILFEPIKIGIIGAARPWGTAYNP
nr:trimethylamine dehydrogenase (EC 1.5.99.7) - Methylophilus methylotrophus (fragments) [Methylophilus methylotrophus]